MQGVHFQCLEVSPNVLGPGIWNRKETKLPHYRKFETVFISSGIESHSGFGPRSFINRGFIPLPPLADINPKIILGGPFPLSLQNRRNFYAFFGRNGIKNEESARCKSCTRGRNAIKHIFFFALPLLRCLLFVLTARLSPIACKTHKIYGCL